MEAGFIIAMIVLCIIGAAVVVYLVAGKSATAGSKSGDVRGTLNVVLDNDAEPGLFVALHVPVEELVNQKRVTFDVNVIQQNSRK